MKIVVITQSKTKKPKILQDEHLKKIKKIDSDAQIKEVSSDDKNYQKVIKTADIIIGDAAVIQTKESAPLAKWFHITSAGVNGVSKAILDSDIIITNSSGVHPIPISEHVFGLMLMLARGLHKAVKIQVQQKTWIRDLDLYQPSELAGKNLLIVGMGRIGERIATLGMAFEMNVIGIVRHPGNHRSDFALRSVSDLPAELEKANYIINCLPSTVETKGLFSRKLLKKIKKGSFYINIGRGDTVDEEALIGCLRSGQIAGAGLDVFEKEPLPDSSPLWEMDNVIITPHYSGFNPSYFDRVINIFCSNLEAYLNKSDMPTLVDKKLGY
jgi:phosphoglycerate dehydrogenase-like enzyme